MVSSVWQYNFILSKNEVSIYWVKIEVISSLPYDIGRYILEAARAELYFSCFITKRLISLFQIFFFHPS